MWDITAWISIVIYRYIYIYILYKDIIIGSGRPRRRKPVRLGWLWCLIEKEAEFEDPETLQATTANNYVLRLLIKASKGKDASKLDLARVARWALSWHSSSSN